MKKIKIIYILPHIPSNVILYAKPEEYFSSPEIGKYQIIDYPPYWVGFFAQDHHAMSAKDLLENTNEFEIECWRPYGYGLKEIRSEIVDGITHKVFPSVHFSISKIICLTWSKQLFRTLVKEIKKNKIIINLSVGHTWFHIILMLKLRKYKNKFGLIAIHRSGGFRRFEYKKLVWWKKLFKWFYLIESFIDELSLRYCDIYYIGSKPEAEYLLKKNIKIKSEFYFEGIDFNKYQVLLPEEKNDLRVKLKLPLMKKILVAYGNWISTDYAYQHLLEVFMEIKKEKSGEDLELLMIGGYKNQDLYEMGIRSGAIMIERTDKTTFIKYLQASDFFTQAVFSWYTINFGGFGTSMVEALACGLPIISNNIIHFPGTDEERKEIGLDMPDKEALKRNILYMKDNLKNYTRCREIAEKYYDIKNTRKVLLNKYRELSKKYFEIDTSEQNTSSCCIDTFLQRKTSS